MIPHKYIKIIEVNASHIDFRNHVNNLVYLNWCIEASHEHWEQKASAIMKKNLIWYVLRHQIEYKSQAFEGDKLKLETWVENCKGARSFRKFHLYNNRNNKLLVKAETDWCLLDARTKKPKLITPEIEKIFIG